MKKILSISATFLIVLGALAFFVNKTNARRPVFEKGTPDEIETAKQISLEILRGKAARNLTAPNEDYRVEKVQIDELKMAHTRVKQTIDNVPVWEGEAIVHLKEDGALSTVTDDLKESVSVVTVVNFTARQAIKIAREMYQGSRFLTERPKADMWIFRGEDRDHLVYRVQMRREDGTEETAMPVIFIDAQTGEKVFEYDNLQTATGSSLYSGTVTINTSSVGSTFYMEDPTNRRQGTFNMNNTGNTSTGTGGTQSRYTDTDDVWNTTAQRAGVDAHYGAAMTYDYYKNVHGRNGIDGNNGPGTTTSASGGVPLVVSRVHFGSNYNNAFWNGSNMTYGDGNGTSFTPLVTLDICGHEMTHGVTERTANLTYSGESGALNESMSDVFGAMVERYAKGESANTWKIGEDAYTPGTAGDALRYMDNPHLAGNGGYTSDDDPDHYSERYTGTADSGGVHINSGIANKAFYLLAKGGTHHRGGSMTGIGADDAAKIWYKALTSYMTSGTNFAGARTATLNAASALYGSTSAQYAAVGQAWCLVGVGTCTSPTPTPAPTATPNPTPTPGTGSELIANGGFEGGTSSPWILSASGAYFNANSTYPHSGVGYINLGVDNNVTGTAYQTVTIPGTATGTLNFWLNITSSETGTTQYDKLFIEVRNTSGTLLATLATFSNVNKGTAGVYSQKSYNLSAYKGQTVRVQFRATMDSSVTTAFRIDDVSLK